MIEKVNPSHPDKIADRIAGAMVDLAYKKHDNPKIAVEVLIGHSNCKIIAETSVSFDISEIEQIVYRICETKHVRIEYIQTAQDAELAKNQESEIRCGDNGIFKGVPIDTEVETLSRLVRELYKSNATDGKYIYNELNGHIIASQSNIDTDKLIPQIASLMGNVKRIDANKLGFWTGGINVDSGATNRKLGSDMGRAVTGGGIHGKDLSKADVALNIYAHLKAQEKGEEIELYCSIGDIEVDGMKYSDIVEIARNYIEYLGGFEKLAEWGLV